MILAIAYTSFTNTIGISRTKTSLNIPPPIAVIIPPNNIGRNSNPTTWYAIDAPKIENTPNPTASKTNQTFICFSNLLKRKNITTPTITVQPT